jgi:hypothetical protein
MDRGVGIEPAILGLAGFFLCDFQLSKLTKNEESLQISHSIDEAGRMDEVKKDREEAIAEDLGKKSTI